MTLALHTIKPKKGSKKRRKRIGRGNASGRGTYSTRGLKGQKARSGVSGLKRLGMRRLLLSIPKKRGFKSLAPKARGINVGRINKLAQPEETITWAYLVKLGIIDKQDKKVKILGEGMVDKPFKVKDIPVSKSAEEKIIAVGGSVE